MDWAFWLAFLIPIGLWFGAARVLVSLSGEERSDANLTMLSAAIFGLVAGVVAGVLWFRRGPRQRTNPSHPALVVAGGAVGYGLFIWSDYWPPLVKIGVMSAFASVLLIMLASTAIIARRNRSVHELNAAASSVHPSPPRL